MTDPTFEPVPKPADFVGDAPDTQLVSEPLPGVREVVADLPTAIKETKAGYKTTEFWLTVAGLVALNLNGVILTLPDKYQALGSAVLAGLYAISRGQAKSGVPTIETPDAPSA